MFASKETTVTPRSLGAAANDDNVEIVLRDSRPPSTWPTIARASINSEIVSYLSSRQSRAWMIIGDAGAGKTTLARSVSADLARAGKTIIPVVGVFELRDVPAAALAPVLASLRGRLPGDADALSVGDRLHQMVALLGPRAADHVLAVDDASLLDEVSAGIIYQLIRVFGMTAIMTDRATATSSAILTRLDAEGLLHRAALAPLSLAEVDSALHLYFGEHASPDTSARLTRASQGNPLMLRELVMTADERGGVRRGPIGIEVDDHGVAPHVLDGARRQLMHLSASETELARMLALSQPWPRDVATAVDDEALASLVEQALVTVSHNGDRQFVRLGHPLLTEALLADMPGEDRTRLVDRAASALRSTRDPDDLRAAIHLCPVDDIATDELEWAARAAASAGDFETALRLATAADVRNPTTSSALVSAVALSALGRDADGAFDRAAQRAVSDEEKVIVALRHLHHLAYRLRDPQEAIRQANRVLDELGDSGDAAGLAAERAKLRAMVGEPADFDAAADAPPLARLNELLTEAMFATMSGDVTAAAAALTEGYPLAEAYHVDLPHARGLFDLSQFLVHVASGDIQAATHLAEERLVDSEAEAAGLWTYTLALVELHAGRGDRALELARRAVQLLEWRDFTGLVEVARALQTTCEVIADAGDHASDPCEHVVSTDVKVTMQLSEAAAWALARKGLVEEASHRLRVAAEEGVRQGHHLLAALTASVAMRWGRARDVADVLAAAAAPGTSVLCELLAQTASASARGDLGRCVALAPRLRHAGMVALALRLAEDATTRTSVPAIRARARVVVAELKAAGTTDPVRTAETDDGNLTAREWQVARAAADRLRSREIADALGLSVRTVDNHLASAYRKLGVSGRDELARMLGTTGD